MLYKIWILNRKNVSLNSNIYFVENYVGFEFLIVEEECGFFYFFYFVYCFWRIFIYFFCGLLYGIFCLLWRCVLDKKGYWLLNYYEVFMWCVILFFLFLLKMERNYCENKIFVEGIECFWISLVCFRCMVYIFYILLKFLKLILSGRNGDKKKKL